MNEALSICSANCQGLGISFSGKRRDVMKYLKSKRFDIYFLQDTHFESNLEPIIKHEWGYECWFSSYTSRARGVAILFSNTFEYKIKNVITDPNGNYLLIYVTISNEDFLLINVYAPNRDEPNFFTEIQSSILNFYTDNIILGGDWNLLLDPKRDGKGYKHVNNPNAKTILNNIIFQFSLVDIWRDKHPTCTQFTWHRKCNNRIIQQGRLDFFLISNKLTYGANKANIIPGYRSDHSFVTIELNKTTTPKTKTFWKFNNNLLKDKEFIENVHQVINDTKERYMPLAYNIQSLKNIENFQPNISDKLFLEVLMMEIRAMTLRYTAIKKKNEKNEEKTLISEIQILEINKVDNEEEITKKVERLEEIRKNKLLGSLIRARANWIENGEKPSKYFCSLENRHFISKRISKLIDKHGKELSRETEIMAETKSFYENLYISQDDKLKELDKDQFEALIENKLPDDLADELEGVITLQELGSCLNNMKNNKSPGTDGFSVEFFKFFWKDMKYFILNSANETFIENELPVTLREGIITCIPKGNKPREYLKNWRPICLLNVIYKLFSGCIAARIKKVLPLIIKEDQTGFIKNRFMGDNLRLTYDIIHHVNVNTKNGILLLIDFEKAFDTISWKFLFCILELFNFKENIKRWVAIFLNKIKSCVVVNNKISEWFGINRGCRQGDPLSPYLFIICAEILAIMIRKNEKIKGINVGSKEIKISLYADDTSLFLDGSKESFEYCVYTVLEYAKYSGLNMNFDKTKVVCLGNLRNKNMLYMPCMNFEWNPESFTILGVEFNVNLENLMDININKKLPQMIGIMLTWSKRNISPIGRITVLKTLVLSKITHILMALPPSKSKVIDELEKRFFKFIWKGKPDQIKRVLAFNKIEDGGLNMINIRAFQQALLLTWLRRLVRDIYAPWKEIILHECKAISNINLFGSLYTTVCRKDISNEFWRNVLNVYKLFCEKHISHDFRYEPLFYNHKANISHHITGCQRLIKHNIVLVNQLYDTKNNRVYTKDEIKNKYGVHIDFLTLRHIEKGLQKIKSASLS